MHANKRDREEVFCGEIAAVGLKNVHTGDTLVQENPIVLERCTSRAVQVAIEPGEDDEERMATALGKLRTRTLRSA